MRELIISMANKNIGSLCLFINNSKNIEYLDYINRNIPIDAIDLSISQKIYLFVNELDKLQLCICGQKKTFIGFKNGYRLTCGVKKCLNLKRKSTCLEKYGVDNPKKSLDINQKTIEKIREKWNGKHYMLDPVIREKFKSTMMSRWGVEWAQQSSEIVQKSNDTFKHNPKRLDIILDRKSKLINKSVQEKNIINQKKISSIEDKWIKYENFINYRLDKIKDSSLKKWNETHHFKVKEIVDKRIISYYNTITNKIIEKLPVNITYLGRVSNVNSTDSIIELNCNVCKNNFTINRQYLSTRIASSREICTVCNPSLVGTSNMELELLTFLESKYSGNILKNTKNIISKEIDFYIPELNLAFEFNGLYWHSSIYKSRGYHLDKTKECELLGIKLFHIWEDDWIYKQNIIRSIIENKLGKSVYKKGARECQIREINDDHLVRTFLETNHIQGFVGSRVKLGLFHDDQLISLMTFGNLRKSLGQDHIEGSWEMLRFCNVLNTNVVGGASKLLKFFMKNYRVSEVISYSDSSRSSGDLYRKLGFNLVHQTSPNYYWIIDGVRRHRFNFRKDKLIRLGGDSNKSENEIMSGRGYSRIFDCGNKKWVLKQSLPN